MDDTGYTPTAYSPDLIVILCVVLPLLPVTAVILRFVVRLRIMPTRLGIDDWMILVAVILLLGDAANLAMSAFLGIQGRDYPDEVPLQRQLLENKSDYAQLILEKPMYGLMKMSMCFFYRRIFNSDRKFMLFNTLVICFLVLWTLAYFIAEIFVCGANPSISWDPNGDAQAVCVNRTILNFTYAVTDAFSDAVVVLMPFPAIRKLNINTRQRVAIVFIFLLAGLSTAASFTRLGFISKATTQNYEAFNINTHGATTPPSIWSMIEGALGIFAACLPPLGPLIRKVPSPARFSSTVYGFLRSGHPRTPATGAIDKSGAVEKFGLDGGKSYNTSSSDDANLIKSPMPPHNLPPQAADKRPRRWVPADIRNAPIGVISSYNPLASPGPRHDSTDDYGALNNRGNLNAGRNVTGDKGWGNSTPDAATSPALKVDPSPLRESYLPNHSVLVSPSVASPNTPFQSNV